MRVQNILSTWNTLDARQRIILGAVTIGVFIAVFWGARLANSPNFALLYSGLDPRASGDVIAALDAEGVAYEIKGSRIYVPYQDRDRLRMSLAASNLPANSTEGYELLERMTGFGTTSQMFDAAYWRAKEGELARTIAAAGDIRSARVHIARSTAVAFQRDRDTSASVTLTMAGTRLSSIQAHAIQFLVGSAVPGLSPQDVTVIDAGTGQVVSSDMDLPGGIDPANRQTALKTAVERLLAARLGPNRAVVELSIETVNVEEKIRERRLDPANRVVLSTDTEERSSQSQGNGQPGVTVASNLPEGDAGAGASQSSQDSETRARVNYDISQTEREVHLAPGAIKRLTVAVLVDGVRTVDETGTTQWSPRPQEELEALQELVQAAVGFNSERGDIVTLRSMQFEHVPGQDGTTAPEVSLFSGLDLNRTLQILLVLIGAYLLARMALRPTFINTPQAAALPAPAAEDALPAALPALETASGASDILPMATIQDFDIPIENDNGKIVLADLPELPPLPNFSNEEEDNPIERLKQLIEDRKEETIEILRGWMEEREEEV